VIMAGLVAGIIFGVWIGFNPQHLSAATYVEQQQNAIKALNTLMPLLGLMTIILTITSAFLQRRDKGTFIVLLVAAVLLIVSGLVTRFGNQPINSIVMTWSKDSVPDNWTELRDKWWSLHIVRTLAALFAFCLIVWASIRKG
jgi:uncharacterized membrane protein